MPWEILCMTTFFMPFSKISLFNFGSFGYMLIRNTIVLFHSLIKKITLTKF